MQPSFETFLLEIDRDQLAAAVGSRFHDKLKNRIRAYSGLDGVSSFEFLANSRATVDAVMGRLLTPGRVNKYGIQSASRFVLTPFKRFEIPKPNGYLGETRPISASSINSIIFQTPLAQYLNLHLEPRFSAVSYGYRTGRSAKDAVQFVAKNIANGYTWILDADIKKFFDSVDHDIMLRLIDQHFPGDTLLSTLIYRFLKTGYVKVVKDKKPRNIRKASHGYKPNHIGIPQGGLVSGILANLYLDKLDKLISQRFPKALFVRYADDFVLLAKNRADIQNAHRVIQDFLINERGLELNKDKTRSLNLKVQRTHGGKESFDFLGYRFKFDTVVVKKRNIGVIRRRLSDIVQGWSVGNDSIEELVFYLRKRIEGRMFDEKTGKFLGRNWARYFSLMSNIGQLRELDSFLVKIVLHALRKRGFNLQRKEVLALRLPSFVNLHYRMKKLSRQSRKRLREGIEEKTTTTNCEVLPKRQLPSEIRKKELIRTA